MTQTISTSSIITVLNEVTKNIIKLETSVTSIESPTDVVRTLREVGNIHELTRELNRYKWGIIGLAKTSWKNSQGYWNAVLEDTRDNSSNVVGSF